MPSHEQDQIARLTRERDLAVTVALTAMRSMTDAQLTELRGALDSGADLLQDDAKVDNHQLSA